MLTDSKGYLYFFDAQMQKQVTIYHKSISKLGHKVIHSKLIPFLDGTMLAQSIMINNFFWLSHHSVTDAAGSYIDGEMFDSESFIWSLKKQQFIQGPKISKEIEFNHYNPHCISTYNRTHFVMLGFTIESDSYHTEKRNFALIEFKSQKMTNFPYLTQDGYLQACFCAIIFSKTHTKTIITHVQTIADHLLDGENRNYNSQILSYDLSFGENGQWKSHQKMPISSHTYLSKYPNQNNF